MSKPYGLFPGENTLIGSRRGAAFYEATGEYREPRQGEYYLSGAMVQAYRAPNDLSTRYWIARYAGLYKNVNRLEKIG